MSLRGPYISGQTADLVPFRTAEKLSFGPGGTVSDLAMLNITRLAPIDRATSALELLKTHPENSIYRCPKEACEQLSTDQCGSLPFCGPSLAYLDWNEPAYTQLNSLIEAGDVGRAEDLVKSVAAQKPPKCHVRLSPFQQVFAQRVVLPRTSCLAYWGVGVGKTAGAAATLIQAGAAIKVAADGRVNKQAIPVHIWDISLDFTAKLLYDMWSFSSMDQAKALLAILTQLRQIKDSAQTYNTELPKKLSKWLREWYDAIGGTTQEKLIEMLDKLNIPDIDNYVASIVIMNEIHKIDDGTYNFLKLVNLACLFKTESPGYPPVIAAFSGTPCAGGLRGLLMTLDLLNNTVHVDGRERGFDKTNSDINIFSMHATTALAMWLRLVPYQTGRVGQAVGLYVRRATLTGTGSQAGLSSTDTFYNVMDGPNLGHVNGLSDEDKEFLEVAGVVTRVVPNDTGVVLLEVQIDIGENENPKSIIVRVPALLVFPSGGGEGSVQGGRPQLLVTTNDDGTAQAQVVDRGNPNDPKIGLYIHRPIILVHGPGESFEQTLVQNFNLWGQMSYVDLSETPMFPTRSYRIVPVPNSALPQSVHTPELVNPLALLQNPELVLVNDHKFIWSKLNQLDRTYGRAPDDHKSLASGSKMLTANDTGKYAWYTTNFYMALLSLALETTPTGWSADGFNLAMPANTNQNENLIAFRRACLDLGLVDENHITFDVEGSRITGRLQIMVRWRVIIQEAWGTVREKLEFGNFLSMIAQSLLPPKLKELAETVKKRTFKGPPMLAYIPYQSTIGVLALLACTHPEIRVFPWVRAGDTVFRLEPGVLDGPILMLVSDGAGADDLDSNKFVVGNSPKPNLLVFMTVPPSRQRMVQAEGRLHRSGCEGNELDDTESAKRVVQFDLYCSGWLGSDATGDMATDINQRRSARPLAVGAGMDESTPHYKRSNSWELVKAGNGTAGSHRVDPSDQTKTFQTLNFFPFIEMSVDARNFIDLQTAVSDYPDYFASLCQQFSTERVTGDTGALGQTVTWTDLAHPPSWTDVMHILSIYLNTSGSRSVDGETGGAAATDRPEVAVPDEEMPESLPNRKGTKRGNPSSPEQDHDNQRRIHQEKGAPNVFDNSDL
jgi:hypothetical protein